MEEKAKEYSKIKNWLILANIGITTFFLIIMLFSGLSNFLKGLSLRGSENIYIQVALYLLFLWIIFYILSFGLDFYGSFSVEHRFSLSNQTFLAWLKENIKKEILSLFLLLLGGEMLYLFLRRFPAHWWLWAGGGWIGITIILSKIAPILIIPLFYRCKPLDREGLKEKLLKLSKINNVSIKEVFEINLGKTTKKANAAITGFGNTRRICLSDTLLNNYSDKEVEVILAHELGHLRMLHLWKHFSFGGAFSLITFYLAYLLLEKWTALLGFGQVSDIAAFPLLALILLMVGLFIMPIQNGFSRHLEKEADLFALGQTENVQSFISAMRKLGKQNLSNPSPTRLEKFLLYDHPSISERIAYTEKSSEGAQFQEEQGSPEG